MLTADTVYRAMVLEKDPEDVTEGVDVEAGIYPVCFGSIEPVSREDSFGKYQEVLSHDPEDVNLGFLNKNGALLFDHDDNRFIGRVVADSARVCPDHKTRCKVEFYEEHREYAKRMYDGLEPNTWSCAYARTLVRRESNSYTGETTIYFAWEPWEVSVLTRDHTPADKNAGMCRSITPPRKFMPTKSLDDLLRTALTPKRDSNFDPDEFDVAEIFDFERKPSGYTREVTQSVTQIGGNRITGRFMPLASCVSTRDLIASTFGSAGALIGTQDMDPAALAFRNHTIFRLGVDISSGHELPFVLPRETGTATVSALSEIAAVTPSGMQMDNQVFGPKRLTVQVVVGNQLLRQSPRVFKPFVTKSMVASMMAKLSRMILNGSGVNEEALGIMQTPGVGAIHFGGVANGGWAGILAAEKSLSDSNADQGTMGWAVSSATRNKWKQTPRISGSTFASFLMEDGEINDYDYVVTQDLSDNNQAVFGNWSDVMLILFGEGVEVLPPNPYTKDTAGETIYTVNAWYNVCVRHPQSFAVSDDSGAV